MKKKVIAIGLDAADPVLLERLISQGHLPNLSGLRNRGAYGRLKTQVDLCGTATDTICSERNWVIFSTGCYPSKTGYWDTAKYHPENYQITQDRNHKGESLGYDYQEFQAFYDLGAEYKVGLFDVPMSGVSEDFNGIQISVWGSHSGSHMDPYSTPDSVLPEINKKYGRNPLFKRDFGVWWNPNYVEWVQKSVQDSVSTRAQVCRDFLNKDSWDLFIAVFGETHSAGHDLLHFSEVDHPLHHSAKVSHTSINPMVEAMRNVDKAVGEILADISEDTYVLVFGVHGITNNMADLCNMAFLPELLYRYNFPGKVGLAPGKLGTTPPKQFANPKRKTWPGEVWQQRFDPNPIKRFLQKWMPSKFDSLLNSGPNPALTSPYELLKQGEDLAWMPNMWYQRLWPQMKAFALPGVAEGFIRINLAGRDRDGIVKPSEYESICNELTEYLYRLTDARTDQPIVKSVARTRPEGDYSDFKRPDADLVVSWHDTPTDVIDSPDFGRIGPLTYYRPGGHTSRGFLLAKGPGIAENSSLPEGQAVDLAPTVLDLMGADIPGHLDGSSLIKRSIPVAT
ncbi:2,3-bisphosphoglycerate-independent phosphoglycerate mutase [Halomicronema hongdechloris C2206]|uniref:2,3-bisphosphoglycerate-independent phosphoglycerate mutase n=1 Tax=Halomicronema hongdechloris C2206 TaxID=1641165 RepID=A0A1Z3HJL0_9CYAN|nr:alkaline phosphatase family protein [Halomicronema hongdechloris]ASC70499.1 2,3-bisphosphoglycerate-independent phosphoglycerate mutase [Halomicronema hongdechloris C2206]